MSAASRTLRFRSAGSVGPAVAPARLLVDLFIGDAATPTGHIVRFEAEPGAPERWAYILADGRATGLHSTLSRADLEGCVAEYYFQELTADQRCSA